MRHVRSQTAQAFSLQEAQHHLQKSLWSHSIKKIIKRRKKISHLERTKIKQLANTTPLCLEALQRNFLPQTILFSSLLSDGVVRSSPSTPKRCLGHLVFPVTLAAYPSHIPLCRVLVFAAFHHSPVPCAQFIPNLHIPTHTQVPSPSGRTVCTWAA